MLLVNAQHIKRFQVGRHGDPFDDAPEPAAKETTYKFQRTFQNNEFLQIMEDFIQGKKLISSG